MAAKRTKRTALKTDPERHLWILDADYLRGLIKSLGTGIIVEAVRPSGSVDDGVDIVELDRASLGAWLREKPGRAEEIVAALLGHPAKERKERKK